MTKREKILGMIVGGALAVLLNAFLINFFIKNHRTLKEEMARKQSHLQGLRALIADRSLWEQRAAWIGEKQPKLVDPGSAGGELMNEVRELAKRHEVQIEPGKLTVNPLKPKETYASASVTVETKSTWKGLVNFMAELQSPEKFIVLESARLEKNTTDPTQMTGTFTIAKWYAPQ